MQKAVIFDWSGTLYDNFHAFCKVASFMFKELGREPLTEEELRENYVSPYMRFWNKYFPTLTKEEQDRLFIRYTSKYGKAALYPSIPAILRYLNKRGYMLFILTSDHIPNFKPQLKDSKIEEMFACVIPEVHHKGRSALKLIREYDLDPKKTYFVGDGTGDVEGGRAAKVKTIAVTWGFESRKTLSKAKPDYLIDDLIELKKIIK